LAWLRHWWPAILWCCLIWFFSTDSFGSSNTSRFIVPLLRWLFPDASTATIWLYHGGIRKAGHFVEYFILSLLLLRGIRAGRAGWRPAWGLAAIALAAGYASIDELHQAFVPSRGASAVDVLIDSAGAFTAQAFAGLAARRRTAGN